MSAERPDFLPERLRPEECLTILFCSGSQIRVILLPPVNMSMNCSPRSASSASDQTLGMACCRTPSSQSAPYLSDRTLPVLPCSCTHSEEPSEEALFLPSKPTPKSSLTDRRVHHFPGVSLPSSKAGKSSLLPSVKLTPRQHGSPNHHKATCAQLVWLLPA